jgi:mannosyltransferase OCH1-like enzyme
MSKIIHYCWFGDKKLDKLALKCIKSWKKFLPDYEIMLWNEKNFDVNSTPFSKKAYEEGKWAFVSDVARIHALR